MQNLREFFKSIGEDPDREGLLDTPKRVEKMVGKLFGGYNENPKDIIKTFDGENYDEMILVKDIEFFSTCEHHMMPFFGKVHIAYIPNGKIVGLSKFPRLVEVFSRRLQNQERLTQQIADALDDVLHPRGVAVIIEAKHLCMMARGVEKQSSNVTTSALKGLFKRNTDTRNEFLRLVNG
ncbi:GTP cyclohydrolase I FolE [Candidatus Peregrinibacteria bacterium CG22_combo_CG10-13_8_21_14_all_44_10]|nr:MAG: GTP cyclohydrolase I FolE [Candidatus Peregrinibacteria bacterium CG2_30_44_17]PIP66001.1 MAG: GTP cyclohydrolase I FolE [Candidatus Peregrinibacteria bacterium CG22_combo_CG10-13_8_21_14_all_44_10]PIX79856.1 MAG: GTP cyclohydrolase I FolE [Candidatus Peregrinibacteria bacterium CG_4_10_14_3_um_filter_44_21]PJB89323.1 MAG: GTP cyclohydrolase I FolE [Candidatus Peregrinibacteria bacterium CG_4_9_14_0_8_um_filter_44_15]